MSVALKESFHIVEQNVYKATVEGAELIEQVNQLLLIDLDSSDDEETVREHVNMTTIATQDLNAAAELIDKHQKKIGALLESSTAEETDKLRDLDKLKREESACRVERYDARKEAEQAEENFNKAEKELDDAEKVLEEARKENESHRENVDTGFAAGTVSGLLGVAAGVGGLLFPPLLIPGAIALASGAGGMVTGYGIAVVNGVQIKSAEEMNRLRKNVTDARDFKNSKKAKFNDAESNLESKSRWVRWKEEEVEECKNTIMELKEQLKRLAVYKQHVVGMKNLMNQVEPEVGGLMKNLKYYLEQCEEGIKQESTKRMIRKSVDSLQEVMDGSDHTLTFLQGISDIPVTQTMMLELLMHNVHLLAIA